MCLGSDSINNKCTYAHCLSPRLGPTSPLEAPERRRRVLAIYTHHIYIDIHMLYNPAVRDGEK